MEFYDKLMTYLEKEDKESAVEYAINLLSEGKIDILTLYRDILSPSLNNMFCNVDEKEVCVWREHVRSSIVRTIIECAYPFVIKEREKRGVKRRNESVIVVCPQEEYHEIGPRMVADFFTLLGFDTVFVGANTPKEDFASAINVIKPKYVVISVTNYYNIVNAERAIKRLKEKANYDLKIIVGGHAFKSNKEVYKKIGADYLLDTFEEIEAFTKEEQK
ncbi:B12-binding domain-containing protein [Caloramator sp. ALD01]|uniref:cobalamin B12-binding domain-containing protein n=1 Tax=Caloramator sp. ALD01 TaxID=1031288 RepID=UPI0004216B23|nr:cobalamin-dependent protein [Caloramator sp. ALD01]